MNTHRTLLLAASILLATSFVPISTRASEEDAAVSSTSGTSLIRFTDVERQTGEFLGYGKTIKLTAEQEKIKEAALGDIKAVCCKDFSALTCCCPCNLSKALWGMAAYLIAEKGATAAQVKVAAHEWIRFVNPEGFSGDACFTGGCSRPFAENGCGGMNENDVQF
jgi:hypothetical protein